MEIENCKQKRTILNLFDVFSCDDCYLLKDEWFYHGKNIIYFAHIGNGLCNKLSEEYINITKFKIILKEFLFNDSSLVMLFFEDDFEKYFDILDVLTDNYSILIVTK